MRAFLLSIYISIASFVGGVVHPPKPLPPTPHASISAEMVTLAIEHTVATPSPTVKRVVLTPTGQPKPTTSITEEILRKFLGQSEQASIDRILNDQNMLQTYENMFYAKFKKFPIPRLDTKKANAMPSKNGPVWCSEEQLKNLYTEIEKTEKEYAYNKMDFDCHYRREVAETKECQDWRRDHDQNRQNISNSDSQIMTLERTMLIQTKAYDSLVENYCTK